MKILEISPPWNFLKKISSHPIIGEVFDFADIMEISDEKDYALNEKENIFDDVEYGELRWGGKVNLYIPFSKIGNEEFDKK